MTDRPILFSAPMVRALLAGTKTQTRRTGGVPTIEPLAEPGRWHIYDKHGGDYGVPDEHLLTRAADYLPIQPRDRLYVREEYYQFGHWEPVSGRLTAGGRQKWAFVADDPEILFSAPDDFRLGRHHSDPGTFARHKRLGRFMPRAASRITLNVTDVRVERLQDISEGDALAEGMTQETADATMTPEELAVYASTHILCPDARGRILYEHIWNSLNGPGSWEANPFVAAYTFTVALGNIDQIARAV